MHDLIAKRRPQFEAALAIWNSGGWAMWAIAAIALVIFGMGAHVLLGLRAKSYRKVNEDTWRSWIERPKNRHGIVGWIFDAMDGTSTVKEVAERFKGVRGQEINPYARDLKVMKIFVSAAPLVGLLGTVTGMLSTFEALASGSGAEKTVAMIASGISEALITTETGLVIALPGLFLQYYLKRKLDRYEGFLAHLETQVSQSVYRRAVRRAKPSARTTRGQPRAMESSV
jgi:biopolymer transport protein ExbB